MPSVPNSCRMALLSCALIAGCADAGGAGLDGDDGVASAVGEKLRVAHPSRGAFAPVAVSGWATATWPQGAHFVHGEGSALQVGVYSAHATRILLEIYPAATGASAKYDYWMAKGADDVWRAEIASVPGKTLYAFRAWGPNWPFDSGWARGGSSAGFIADVDASGNRFDPNKVLFDPYAVELTHDKPSGMTGTGDATYQGLPRRAFDTGAFAPKSVALVDATDTGTKPGIAAADAVIYEAHVRGLTAHPSSTSLTAILAG